MINNVVFHMNYFKVKLKFSFLFSVVYMCYFFYLGLSSKLDEFIFKKINNNLIQSFCILHWENLWSKNNIKIQTFFN